MSDNQPRFPTYLLPSFSVPFRRRRQSSTVSTSFDDAGRHEALPSLSTSPTESIPLSSPDSPLSSESFWHSWSWRKRSTSQPRRRSTIARIQPDTLRCTSCATDVAFTSQIVSKGFTGRYGRAYLVSPPDKSQPAFSLGKDSTADIKQGELINVKVGKAENRQLSTGAHVVADIICAVCHIKLGWKYVDAKEETQKYKVGKFILETQRVVEYRSWEDVDGAPEHQDSSEHGDVLAVSEPEVIEFDSEDEDECEDMFAGVWDEDITAKRRRRKVAARTK